MTMNRLEKVHKATPFQPFTLEIADGSRIRVKHPENVSYDRKGRTIAVAEGPDDIRIIDLLLVSAIHIGNGAGKRSKRRS